MTMTLDYDNQLTLLARWYMKQDTDDIAAFDKSLFRDFKDLYKCVSSGAVQLTESAKIEIDPQGGETPITVLASYGTDTFLYKKARTAALMAQRSIFIDKLNVCADEERQKIYNDIEEISDLIAGKEQTPISKFSASSYLADLIEDTEEAVTSINTGFTNFNNAMDGGLYPGLYILGAISSMGKTSFMLQLADQIAAAGENVLYFTLEMGARELIAKSISRLTYTENLNKGLTEAQIDNRSITARSVLDRSKRATFNNYQINNIENAQNNYYSEISNNLWYFESLGDIGTNDIRREIEKHVTATGRTPIIFIDYLQILKPYSEYWTEKRNTDRCITELRKLSRDYKAVIFCISSLNRGSYTGDIEMDAFKESGAIEYGSDVLLALQTPDLAAGETPRERKENKEIIEQTKRNINRNLELKVLKNRSGATGQRISFKYNAKFNYFTDEDIAESFTEYSSIINPFNK